MTGKKKLICLGVKGPYNLFVTNRLYFVFYGKNSSGVFELHEVIWPFNLNLLFEILLTVHRLLVSSTWCGGRNLSKRSGSFRRNSSLFSPPKRDVHSHLSSPSLQTLKLTPKDRTVDRKAFRWASFFCLPLLPSLSSYKNKPNQYYYPCTHEY